MDCPNGWDCTDKCRYWDEVINNCLFRNKIPFGQEEKLKQGIKHKREKVALVKADSETFWEWWGKTSPPDALNQKEPLPLAGGRTKGGGSSNGRRKKKPKKKVPEYLKTWGT